MSECGTEFVRMITSVGYEIAEKEGMSTIAPRHVVAALIELGYGEFVDEVQALVGQLKDSEKLKVGAQIISALASSERTW